MIVSLIAYLGFVFLIIAYASLTEKIPSLSITNLLAVLMFYVFLLVSKLFPYGLYFWSYFSLYWFLIILFYFCYFSLNKSVSVRILIDLQDQPDKKISFNTLLNKYMNGESLLYRLALLEKNRMVTKKNQRYRLTNKSKPYIKSIIALQKLFFIKSSG